MALFTGKGDKGTTKLFDTPKGERVSKSSEIFEALGTVDELNSFLGICKAHSNDTSFNIAKLDRAFSDIVFTIQKDLFIVQAELAGAEKKIPEEKVTELTDIVNATEEELPEIDSFFIPGATHLGALFDYGRTLARRAERRIIAVHENGHEISEHTRAYINRLSSVMYALARLSNHLSGITETPPDYE